MYNTVYHYSKFLCCQVIYNILILLFYTYSTYSTQLLSGQYVPKFPGMAATRKSDQSELSFEQECTVHEKALTDFGTFFGSALIPFNASTLQPVTHSALKD